MSLCAYVSPPTNEDNRRMKNGVGMVLFLESPAASLTA